MSDIYVVIFTRRLSGQSADYDRVSDRMLELAEQQEGFIAFNSASGADLGISVSYWEDLASIRLWKENLEHVEAQILGRERFYRDYSVQVCKLERSYSFGEPPYHVGVRD